jgi:hypothetical protein
VEDFVSTYGPLIVAVVTVVMTQWLTDQRERRRLRLESDMAPQERGWKERSTAYMTALRELLAWRRVWDRTTWPAVRARNLSIPAAMTPTLT